MNYIAQLRQERDETNARLAAALAEIEQFRLHLSSPKFCGVDTNGERKDWIATADVHRRLDLIRGAATTEGASQ